MAMKKEKGSVSIDAQNIMPVIKRWLYSDKDIFLREAVSNACDAITKFRMLHPDSEEEMAVTVTVDKEKKLIRISDTGIGMTADEVRKYINQVAFSGAAEFMKQFENEKPEEKGDIIGHFGLGFYSVFMVSEKVEIQTLSSEGEADPVHWVSEDGMSFELSGGKRKVHGTDIILHITEEEKEFLDVWKVREVLNRYCGYMAYPVMLEDANAKPVEKDVPVGDEKNEDGTQKTEKVIEVPKPQQINDTAPLWLKKPSDCTEEEYKEFYHKVFMDFDDPLFWIHLNVDYPFNLKGILYFPKLKNDFGTHEGQIKLFAGQVFVADNIKEVIPEFLMLLKGVIDCPDLPLNVSRSFLQNDGEVAKISRHITKKVADKLLSVFNTERKSYESYWDDISPFIKFGCIKDEKFYEKIKGIILYKTINDEYKTFDELQKADNKVYYVSSTDVQGQYIKIFKDNGLEAVILEHNIDAHFVTFLEYMESGTKFVRIDSEIGDALKSEENTDTAANSEEVIGFFKEALGMDKLTIQTENLKTADTPAILTINEYERRMSDISKIYGNMFGETGPASETLIVNTANSVVRKLKDFEPDKRNLLCRHIFDLALMSQRKLTAAEMEGFMLRSVQVMSLL